MDTLVRLPTLQQAGLNQHSPAEVKIALRLGSIACRLARLARDCRLDKLEHAIAEEIVFRVYG